MLDAHLASVDDVAEHYAWSYVDFLERYRERFGRAFAAIADADGAVVVHCVGGKDRTGLVSALLLRLAGVGARDDRRGLRALGRQPRAVNEQWLAEAADEAEREKRRRARCTLPPRRWSASSRRSSVATATSRRTCARPA